MKFLTNLDLIKNQLVNCVIQKVAADPTTKLAEGWIIFNTTEAKLKYYNGEEWVAIDSGGGGGSTLKIVRKTNAALTPVDGVAEWTISDVAFSGLPSISIYETSSGEQILADVSVDTANSEITITFKNVSDTIASGYYTAVIVA